MYYVPLTETSCMVQVKLRKRYETAVQNRNDRGIQLIEREEEVCVFYERLNIQGLCWFHITIALV